MPYTEKLITLTFQLGQGQFGDTGSNTVTLSGLRVSAKITKTGGEGICECQLRIFGMLPTEYNSLTQIYNVQAGVQKNIVTVQAGDAETGMSTVFVGQILVAQIDLNSQPDSVMNVIAQTAYLQSLQPIQPVSYPKGTTVVAAMQNIASLMGLQFEPNNVTAVLPPFSFSGTARAQAVKILEAAPGVQWNSGDQGVLAIWNRNTARSDVSAVPVISHLTNMIGYPSFSNMGIGIKCTYNPDVQYFGKIQVVSSLQVANLNAVWTVYGLTHTLESNMPEGNWMTEIQAQNYDAL